MDSGIINSLPPFLLLVSLDAIFYAIVPFDYLLPVIVTVETVVVEVVVM